MDTGYYFWRANATLVQKMKRIQFDLDAASVLLEMLIRQPHQVWPMVKSAVKVIKRAIVVEVGENLLPHRLLSPTICVSSFHFRFSFVFPDS